MKSSPIYIGIDEWCDLADKHNIKPSVVMEIGSMDGADADMVGQRYNTNNVIIIEAHPVFAQGIKKKFPKYSVFNFAVSDKEGEVTFNAVDIDSENKGMSSLLYRDEKYPSYGVNIYTQELIDCHRMDSFCESMYIKFIDLLKIDVEGNTYEVLDGFGDMLWFVKCLHIECEHETVWSGQKLYPDVEKLLLARGFIPIAIKIGFPQSDSVWVKKEFYNPDWVNI